LIVATCRTVSVEGFAFIAVTEFNRCVFEFMICLFCNFDPYVLSINAFLPGKTPLPVVWLSYPLDKLFATIYTILTSLAAAFCVFRFTAYLKRDFSIYLFAAFRTKAHRRVCPPVIQVGASVISHCTIASFSENFETPL
jgi:hypothetical protein